MPGASADSLLGLIKLANHQKEAPAEKAAAPFGSLTHSPAPTNAERSRRMKAGASWSQSNQEIQLCDESPLQGLLAMPLQIKRAPSTNILIKMKY